MNYDVIGDVHGEHGKLVDLLKLLGYCERAGAWRHHDRMAVFVGDLIDRGPHQLATVALVRAMVEAGARKSQPAPGVFGRGRGNTSACADHRVVQDLAAVVGS